MYTKGDQLRFCINDAHDLADKLRSIHFHVTLGTDLCYEKMNEMIEDLARDTRPDDLVVFAFSGHGTHFDGQNFLIPTNDDHIVSPQMFEYQAINVSSTIEMVMARRPSALVLLLDCCHNYLINDESGSKNVFDYGGLLSMEKVDDLLIAFACDADEKIPDKSKNGRNSIFTAHLLEHITQSSLIVEEMIRLVCNDVMNETNDDQRPFVISALRSSKIHFNYPKMSSKSSCSLFSREQLEQMSMCKNVFRKYFSQLIFIGEMKNKLVAFSEQTFSIDFYHDTVYSQCYRSSFEISLPRDTRGLLRVIICATLFDEEKNHSEYRFLTVLTNLKGLIFLIDL